MLMNRRESACRSITWVAFLLTLFFLIAEIRLLRIPAQRDYGEGNVLWMTQRVPDKSYPPLHTLPFVVFPYTPLYLYAARLVGGLADDLVTAGRTLSLLSTL